MITATVSGRLGKDAEVKKVGDGSVTSFSVATDQREGRDKKTTVWLDCQIWGTRGTAISGYLIKGKFVVVTGTLKKREHEGKTYWRIDAADVDLGPASGDRPSGSSAAAEPAAAGGAGSDGDDIPFVANVACDTEESWWERSVFDVVP